MLLAFLEPLPEERAQDSVMGIGWGLKTLGRHYPDLVATWLEENLRRGRRPRALMLRRGRTYLRHCEVQSLVGSDASARP